MNKSLKYTLIGIVVILVIVLGVKAFSQGPKEASDMASNDTSASSSVISSIVNADLQKDSQYANAPKDKNGCIISANYVWDMNLGSCVPASKVSNTSSSTTSVSTTTKASTPNKSASVPASIAENLCRSKGGEWSTTFRECLNVDKQMCSDISGTYNECASACRHDPYAEVCPTYCVEVCTIR